MKTLTSRQAEILLFIGKHCERNGFPPSVRDIGARFGLNPATVHDHIRALERKGRLHRQPKLSRSLVVINPDGPTEEHLTPNEVPIVGRVAAGAPILAQENIEDVVRLPDGWAPEGAFLLRVEGDSMQDAHILDGDYVLVRPDKTASNGEIVVAMIEDEATVKRFYRRKNRVELRSENPVYAPIEVRESEATEFAIIGKVIGVFRV